MLRDAWAVCLTFSPDGSRIACACDDETVRIWDVKTAEQIAVKRSVSWAKCLEFSPDGTRINASGHIWDVNNESHRRMIHAHPGPVKHLRYLGDGTRLVSSGSAIIPRGSRMFELAVSSARSRSMAPRPPRWRSVTTVV